MKTGILGVLLGLKGLLPEKKTAKPSIIKDLIENPENFKLEASVEKGEILVRISRKPVTQTIIAKNT